MDSPKKVVIVVPTIRENNIKDFLQAWGPEFKTATLVIVEDNPERTFKIGGANVEHLCHQDIDKDLGKDAWIIPRKTDCVRSYGYFKRSVPLPSEVEGNKAEAKFDKGVLTIRLPKSERAKQQSTKVPIKA